MNPTKITRDFRPYKPATKEVAIDKKLAAIHEAGHAIVAFALGAECDLTLKLIIPRNELENSCVGSCSAGKIKGKMNNASRAYAGTIAEILYPSLEADLNSTWEYIDTGIYIPSSSDMISINAFAQGWRRRAVERSLEILKSNWTAVRGVAFVWHESWCGREIIVRYALEQPKWFGLL